MSVFDELKTMGRHNNTILYTTLIKGYGQKNLDLAAALRLFAEMKVEGVPINTITYNSIIDVAVRTNDLDKAEALYQELEAAKQANLAEIAEIERANGLPPSAGEYGQSYAASEAAQYEAETKRSEMAKARAEEMRAAGKSEEDIEQAEKEAEEKLK